MTPTARTPTCRVTLARKRYTCPRVFACIGCDLLAYSNRSNTITCSGACRTRIHRHPEKLRALESTAAALHITVMDVLDADATRRLRPDLGERIMRGEIETDDARPEVWAAFWKLLQQRDTSP